jgi:hypothetical protein
MLEERNEVVARIIRLIELGDRSLTELTAWDLVRKEAIKKLAPYLPKSHIRKVRLGEDMRSAEDMIEIAPFITSAPILHLKLQACDTNIVALAAFLIHSSLRSLQFIEGQSSINYRAALTLAEALKGSNISHLSLETRSSEWCSRDCGSIIPFMFAIAKSKVTHLSLHNGKVIFTDMAHMGPSLLSSQLISLDISSNNISENDLKALAPFISRSTIKELTLSNNSFSDEGIINFAPYLRISNIERLVINNSLNSASNVANQGIKFSAHLIPNSKLRCLYLNNNNIEDEGLASLGAAMANSPLEILDVGENKITALGVKAILPSLKISKLKKLNIGNNLLGNEGLALIASVLNDTEITCLGIENINLSNNGLSPLLDILSYSKLIQLILSSNNVEDANIQALAVAIIGSQLLELEMRSIFFTLKSMQYLARALPRTNIIKFLCDINKNYITACRAFLPYSKISWINFDNNNPRYLDELECLPSCIEGSGVTCVGFPNMRDTPKLAVALDKNQAISNKLFGLCRDETIEEFRETLAQYSKFLYVYENFDYTYRYFSDNMDFTGQTLVHIAAKEGQLQVLKAIHLIMPKSVFYNMLLLFNEDSKSALNLARENSHLECCQWIESIINNPLKDSLINTQGIFESCSIPLQEVRKNVIEGMPVKQIDLFAQYLTADDIRVISEILQRSPVLKLNFNNTAVAPEHLQALAPAIIQSQVIHLGFADSGLDSSCLEILSTIITQSRVEFIDFSSNLGISIKAWELFFKGLDKSSILGLNLKSCYLKSEGIDSLSTYLKNSKLTYLNIGSNDFQNESLKLLVLNLPNSLAQLDIRFNPIEGDGFNILIQHLAQTSIVYLDASHNKLNVEDLTAFTKAISKTHLTHLKLSSSRFSPEAALQFIKSLGESNLVNLDLHIDHFTSRGRNRRIDFKNHELSAIIENSSLLKLNYPSGYDDCGDSKSDDCAPELNHQLQKNLWEAYQQKDLMQLESLLHKLPSLVYVAFDQESNNSLLHCAIKLQSLKLCLLIKKMMPLNVYVGYLSLRNDDLQSPMDIALLVGNEMLLVWLRHEISTEWIGSNPIKKISAELPEKPSINFSSKSYARSWHFDFEQHKELLKESKSTFELLDAAHADIEKVIYSYQHHPVAGMDIQRIQVIYNPEMNRGFSSSLALLNRRASKPAFKPKWDLSGWRKEVSQYAINLSEGYTDTDYPFVHIMPTWHGTSAGAISSICETGYASLATTDAGFFGKGIYTTHEAEYAYRVYSKGGPIVLNWSAFFSAYPVIEGDMNDLIGAANFANSDAHFIPVVAKAPHDTINYVPTKPQQSHQYTELVVFQANQCLPRYLVTLQKRLPSRPLTRLSRHPLCLFNSAQPYSLLEAAQDVYDTYLVKGYTLKDYTLDWSFSYNGKSIARPNHGIAHTLSTALYVPSVITFYIATHEHNMSASDKQLLRANIHWIQLAMLFFVVGRENESGSRESEEAYLRFRKNSADAFMQYVQSKKYPIAANLCQALKNAIYQASFEGSHLNAVMKICHDIDTLRCQNEAIYGAICNPLMKRIGTIGLESMQDLVLKAKQMTGDRILGKPEFSQSYQGDLFIKCSTDPQLCWQKLKEAEHLWLNQETNLAAHLKLK